MKILTYKDSDIKRFFNKVSKTSTCWKWIGAKHPIGYGVFRDGSHSVAAHRFSYQLHKGKIPLGNLIMHSCDNRNCVNPSHLSAGTTLDNMRDMYIKKRNRGVETYHRGGAHHNAKLTEQQASELRQLYKTGKYTWDKLAKKFGVSKKCAGNIINMKTYK